MLAASISRLVKPSADEEVEARVGELLRRDAERGHEVLAQGPLVERELDVEGGRKRLLHLLDRLRGEALLLERGVVDAGRLAEAAVADGIGLDLGDLRFGVAEHAQGLRHRAVDDLEVAAAGELLELDQREVGLDAGGVAIHHQADGAGRRDHRDLRVAVAVLLAERERAVPGAAWHARPCADRDRPCDRAAPAASQPSRSRCARHGRRGGGCGSRAACARGSSCSRGRRRAAPPSRPRWRS